MVIFNNSYICNINYQRVVIPIKSHDTIIFLWFSHGFPVVTSTSPSQFLRSGRNSSKVAPTWPFFLSDLGAMGASWSSMRTG